MKTYLTSMAMISLSACAQPGDFCDLTTYKEFPVEVSEAITSGAADVGISIVQENQYGILHCPPGWSPHK